MTSPHLLFEVSWEVCNKVGGIHTVVSSKARTLVERYGDDYIAVGPWLLREGSVDLPFDDEPGYDDFIEACRTDGVPVRVGRWRIPGRPLTVLVAFSELYAQKDAILAGLWEDFSLDSLLGGWDYVEPVLFGRAAGMAISRWRRTYRPALERPAVAQFHEWMTGSGLLYVRKHDPEIATVFTTHATVLGRATTAHGIALDSAPPGDLASELGVRSKHGLEGISAREADVFTTVSGITADEAETAHGRRPDPLLPNGIDLAVIDELTGGAPRDESRARVFGLVERVLGAEFPDARLVCISGRYEFHNKGIDLLLDAAAQVNQRPGETIVLLVLVPAGNSGLSRRLMARIAEPDVGADGPIGLSTHNLFDPRTDPVQTRCEALGLDNAPSSRVKVIQVPIYLDPSDGLLGLTYESVLQAMDLSCFPSRYEPWGYTPQESLAVGVPTVTSDLAGFGRWCEAHGVGPADGVHVLARDGVPDAEATGDLAAIIEEAAGLGDASAEVWDACRRTAQRTAWTDLAANHLEAFSRALDSARERGAETPPSFSPTVTVPGRTAADGQKPRLIPFNVSATLPPELADLERLARNYWWSGDPDAGRLFASLSPNLWEACGHNPTALLKRLRPEVLADRSADPDYVARLRQVMSRFDAYVSDDAVGPLAGSGPAPTRDRPVAYFCAEFGIHESLPIYSGGLGVLAGDHLKSASDMNVPMVAVGLFYRKGYFSQKVTASGEQLAEDIAFEPGDLSLELVRGDDGEPVEAVLQMPGRRVAVRAWRANVGRVTLYLLDTNVPSNRPEDRDICRNLYTGDADLRLRQWLVLGKGGVRVLRQLGIEPSAYHLNEGHAALVGLERISRLVHGHGLTFEEARTYVRATTVFTTHTPVGAGHDRFNPDLMRQYFADVPSWIGVPWESFIALGERSDEPGVFNMTGLALNIAGTCNSVSRLHRHVSQGLLHGFWPRRLQDDVPIRAVTNGVHLPSWTHHEIAALLGASGRAPTGEDFRRASTDMDAADLWTFRSRARARLFDQARAHLTRRFVERHDSPSLLTEILDGLEDDALVIGFARRFAPYKRANLLLADINRLAGILGRTDRPVRVVFAGKAHPSDGLGQALLKQIVEMTRGEPLRGRVFFLEDHDIALARLLVQGCDVWLNTPTRTLEASGTSGMKAAANGALNLSILDGWWAEAFDGDNGWAIGAERVYDHESLQNELDSAVLYQILEDEVIPAFFERDAGGLPQRWLERVRHSLTTIPPVYNTDRMIAEYHEMAYAPLAVNTDRLSADEYSAARASAERTGRVLRGFGDVAIRDARIANLDEVRVGDTIAAYVDVRLGDLEPDDVAVELVLGNARGNHSLGGLIIVPMAVESRSDGAVYRFEGRHTAARAGAFAYGIRVRGRVGELSRDDLDAPVVWA